LDLLVLLGVFVLPLLGLVRFGRIGPKPSPIQRIKMGCFQSWPAPEELFGSA
jgi:hypothetical protein